MDKLMPATVFFRGQAASVQARNSGGIKLPDGMFVLVALVDTSGYSTGIQQKYQGYFITEVTLNINGQTLKPVSYTHLDVYKRQPQHPSKCGGPFRNRIALSDRNLIFSALHLAVLEQSNH